MKITTDHPQSSYGVPIFVDDNNCPIDYSDGIKYLRNKIGLNTESFGTQLGVSGRTVEDWEQGRSIPPTPTLLLIKIMASDLI